MKRKFTILAVALVIVAAQFITYHTSAESALSKRVIRDLIINNNYPSDTILLRPLISVSGDKSIKAYPLQLSSKENFPLLKKKLAPGIVLDATDRTSNSTSIKSGLSIVALEEHTFSVTVNTNYSYQSEFYYNEDNYVWILFSWFKL